MRSSTIAVELVRLWAPDNLRRAAPGVALCAAIAAMAFVADTQEHAEIRRRLGAAAHPHPGHRHGAAAAVGEAGLEARTRIRRPHAAAGRRRPLRRATDPGPARRRRRAARPDRPCGGGLHHHLRRLGVAPVRPVARLRPFNRLRDRRVRRGGGDGCLGGAAQAREFRPRSRLHGDGRELHQHGGDGDLSRPARRAGLFAVRDGRVPGRRHP